MSEPDNVNKPFHSRSAAPQSGGPRPSALYDRIADHLRGLIKSNELQPGQRLPTERDLARELGVSRVPIREAMRTLAAEGLIEIRRGRGMFVVPRAVEATIEELTSVLFKQRDLYAELFAIRRLLEPASVQWAAARADEESIERLRQIVVDMEAAGRSDPPDYDRIGDRDTQLHVEIADCAGNRVLIRIMKAIQDIHRQQLETSLRYQGRVPQTLKDHRRIVEAIAAADPVEARSAMLDHLDRAEHATMRRIEGVGRPYGNQNDSPLPRDSE